MADEKDKFTLTRISAETHRRIKIRSLKNYRSIPKEIDFLLDTVEALEQTGVQKVEVLPGPKGSQKVPVVYISEQEQA